MAIYRLSILALWTLSIGMNEWMNGIECGPIPCIQYPETGTWHTPGGQE